VYWWHNKKVCLFGNNWIKKEKGENNLRASNELIRELLAYSLPFSSKSIKALNSSSLLPD